MKILLDTCTFLWIALDSPDLSAVAKAAFKNPENEIFLSAISAWEISIKHGLKKLHLPEAPEKFVASRRVKYEIAELPLFESHALKITSLPNLHQDPFDRALVAQSIIEGLTIATPDTKIKNYGVLTIW